jgi:hypothetical protein
MIFGDASRVTTVEPAGNVVIGPETVVTGSGPAVALPSWWPWIVAAIAIGGLLYLTREKPRPLGRAG